jgi:hypothetical protein
MYELDGGGVEDQKMNGMMYVMAIVLEASGRPVFFFVCTHHLSL